MHRGAWPLTLKTRQQRKLAPIWMRSAIKNLRYRLKKKYFNGVPANEIRTTSPVDYMSNAQWRDLIAKCQIQRTWYVDLFIYYSLPISFERIFSFWPYDLIWHVHYLVANMCNEQAEPQWSEVSSDYRFSLLCGNLTCICKSKIPCTNTSTFALNNFSCIWSDHYALIVYPWHRNRREIEKNPA